jgi:hypothetical protein
MQKLASYSIVLICLFFLLFATIVACSQTPANIEQPPASQKAAEFEVGPITTTPSVVMVGDTVAVTATIRNTGDIAGTYNTVFLVDGQETGTQSITVDPGNAQEVNFQLSKITAGSHEITIDDSSTVLTVYNWTPYTIQYDKSDGVSVCIYVSGENGHIVHFTPPNKAYKIQKIEIFGTVSVLSTSAFDANHVTVRIWDKDGNNQLWSQDFPWRLFQGPAIWREIEVPDIRVNGDFYVELVTHSNPAGYRSDGSIAYGGNAIEFVQLSYYGTPTVQISDTMNVVDIGFDYPQSYTNSSSDRPETRSGYSLNGKAFDPGQGRLEGINWLIRVEGEGAPG